MITAHEYTLTVDGVPIPVEGGQVVLDETWSPYVQAEVTIPLPSSAVLARLDPRAAGRARLTLAARYGSPTPVSRVTDLWAGRALSEVTKGKVLRRNLVPNPSFEAAAGVTGWAISGGSITSTSAFASQMWEGSGSGERLVQATASGTASYLTLHQPTSPQPVKPGDWIAVAVLVASDSLGTLSARGVRLEVACSGSAVTYHNTGARVQAPFYPGRRLILVFQAPPSASKYAVNVNAYSGSTSVPLASGQRMWVDDVISATAPTEAEARAAVETYFDGDTTDTATRLYEWEGTPHASASVERDLSTAWGGLTHRAITAELSEPLNPSGHRDTSTRTLDLGVVDREIDRRGATVTLSLASDEVLLQEHRTMTPLNPATWTVRAAVNLALSQIGASLQPGTADGAVTGESAVWEVGTSAWDYAHSLVDAAGLRLWCDESRRWWLTPPLSPEDSPDVFVVTVESVSELRERLARDEWATGVIVTYEWDTAAGRQVVHDTAGGGQHVMHLTVRRPHPGNGAAAAILARVRARGSRVTATRVATYEVTPGWVMQSLATDTAHQAGLVSSVRWSLDLDTVEVASRDLTDTPGRAWILQPAGYRWTDVPAGVTWQNYTTPSGA